MLWRMLRQSWGRNLRRKVLAIITVFLASSLISALLAVSIDIGDKMSRELKSYGANILIEPAGQAALPALFSESSNPLSGQDFLDGNLKHHVVHGQGAVNNDHAAQPVPHAVKTNGVVPFQVVNRHGFILLVLRVVTVSADGFVEGFDGLL